MPLSSNFKPRVVESAFSMCFFALDLPIVASFWKDDIALPNLSDFCKSAGLWKGCLVSKDEFHFFFSWIKNSLCVILGWRHQDEFCFIGAKSFFGWFSYIDDILQSFAIVIEQIRLSISSTCQFYCCLEYLQIFLSLIIPPANKSWQISHTFKFVFL